jgi:hypothetical protein
MSTLIALQVNLLTALRAGPERVRSHGVVRDDRGQTTAEYALVLIGAAALAFLLLSWASQSGRIGQLFDFVLDQVRGRAG